MAKRKKAEVIPINSKELDVPKGVEELRDELAAILPEGKDRAFVTAEVAGARIAFPVDNPTVSKAISTTRMKNRTVLDLGFMKIGLDVV